MSNDDIGSWNRFENLNKESETMLSGCKVGGRISGPFMYTDL